MKRFAFVTVFIVLSVLLHQAYSQQSPKQKQYTSRFDNVDVDKILNNDRILSNYIKCLLEKGPCTQEGRELKKTLPDAFRSNCDKCTETQRRNARKVIFHLQDKKQKEYAQLVEKYDPEGIYREKWTKENQQS
ncbi:ejaculatory bulb-specific protein 3-like [Culicoides brevitarsis]|uniref:ejaculatory bulb-specific protein 3-like n=1 Tax=Culicoides brevitarsis TaxID=469753 RepID=UPI00307BA4A9